MIVQVFENDKKMNMTDFRVELMNKDKMRAHIECVRVSLRLVVGQLSYE